MLTAYGSRGDLAPFVALGRALREQGHEVVLAVDPAHRRAVEAAGLSVQALPASQADALRAHTASLAEATAQTFVETLAEHHLLPALPATAERLGDLCRGADMLVASPLQLAAPVVAESLDLPWATLTATPLGVPSPGLLQAWGGRSVPPPGGASTPAAATLRTGADEAVNTIRERWGLPARGDVLGLGGLSPHLTAVAVSPSFISRPPDWPAAARLTGFVFDDRDRSEDPSPERLGPVLAESAAIAVCAGSSAPALLDELLPFYRGVVAAIRKVVCRPLLLGTGLPDGPLEGGLAVANAPLEWVYRRCRAVVHHGGTGTTALALRAGVPALVVPWASWAVDRAFNAVRVEELGAGRYLTRPEFGAAAATAALLELLDDPAYRAAARAFSRRIALEDGLGELVRAVAAGVRPRTVGSR